MQIKTTQKNKSIVSNNYQSLSTEPLGFPPERIIEYFGNVCNVSNEKAISEIKILLTAAPKKSIVLLITSTGGPSGVGMSFYDTMRFVLKPRLVTIGSGDVDSSGVILFLSGETRFVTPNTTMLLHMAGRTFDGGKRFTAHDLEVMATEDHIKDSQYAAIVADNSHGKLTARDVLEMMQAETILDAQHILSFGLADTILS